MSGSSEGFLTREELLSPPSLDEKVVELAGFGKVLCGELSGEQRASLTEKQTESYQAGKADIRGYQSSLLSLGLLDPSSPAEARVPLLREADVPALMQKLGGGKVRLLLSTIEQLSGMGQAAVEAAKGDSDAPASAGGTSA